MAAETLDAVRKLEDEFAEAMTRMYAVGNGLAALRQGLLLDAGQRPVAVAVAQGATTTAPGPTSVAHPDPVAAPVPPATPAPQPRIRQPWWQREGMIVKLLGIAGAGVLLIGVALLLAYAIQHGYLGPQARVAGAAALAAGLVAAAHRIHRDPQRATGALAIASAGYATAYLDVIALTRIYEWIPAPAGLALAGVIGASGVILARMWDSQFLATLTIVGVAALAPAISSPREIVTAGFLGVLAIASYPAHLGRAWPAVHLARTGPAALAVLYLASTTTEPDQVLALATVLAGFELGTALISARRASATLLLTPVLVLSALPLLVAAEAARPARWLTCGIAALLYLAAAYLARREQRTDALRLAPWAAVIGTAFAVAALTIDTGATWRTTALCALALAYAASTRVLGDRAPRWQVALSTVLTGAAVLAAGPAIGKLTSAHSAGLGTHLPEMLTLLAATAAVIAMIAPLRRYAETAAPSTAPAIVPAGAAVALLTGGSALVATSVLIGRRLGMPTGGFITGQGLASLLLAGVAAYLLMHGLGRAGDTGHVLRAGLALAAAAVAKLLFFDLSTLDGIVRIAAFIGAGLALLAMGTGYAKALDRARPAPTHTPTPTRVERTL